MFNNPTPTVARCTIRNQHNILKSAVADVCKEQTDMSHKSELQTLIKRSMKHRVCPSETCCITISVSSITLLKGMGAKVNVTVTIFMPTTVFQLMLVFQMLPSIIKEMI